ncbi:MAG: hypothetical protein ACOCP4_01705 [Candidatus Woesearchaeota archaeon]
MKINDLNPTLLETTTACSVSSVVNPKKTKKKKKMYNKDGTIKNAVISNDNIFSGETLKR